MEWNFSSLPPSLAPRGPTSPPSQLNLERSHLPPHPLARPEKSLLLGAIVINKGSLTSGADPVNQTYIMGSCGRPASRIKDSRVDRRAHPTPAGRRSGNCCRSCAALV